MTDLSLKHPEVLRFKQDQLLLDEDIRDYLKRLGSQFPQLVKNLKIFREKFSTFQEFNTKSVEELMVSPTWTFNKTNGKLAVAQLERIAENYPVPKVLKEKVQTGLYLDLRNESDNSVFLKELDKFAKLVEELNNPTPIKIDLSKIGRLPLKEIHDPLLEDKVGEIWTLDVSYNPGLSIKDIMALQMVQDDLESGRIKENTILVEGTSGNTGAGIAIIAAHYGLKTILIIPDKQSQEKADRLRYLGAHVVVTPTKVAANDPKSYYSVRDYLTKKVNGWKASQYDNLSNRKAHERITGPEIWEQTKGKVTTIISTAGTCGTVSGIGRYLKQKSPDIKIFAVDTVGSILYLLKEGYTIEEVEKYAEGYLIQGFGEDIHPKNLDLNVVDEFLRVSDKTGLLMARIIPALGFIQGQSSGAAYAALVKFIARGKITHKDKVVVIFPDIGVPYRTDVYSDEWMQSKKLIVGN